MASDNAAYKAQTVTQLMRPLARYLDDPAITELRVRPGEIVSDAYLAKGYQPACLTSGPSQRR